MWILKQILGWLAVLVAAASTVIGTVVAYVVFRMLLLPTDCSWWLSFLFVLLWYFGGHFVSMVLLALAQGENTENILHVRARARPQPTGNPLWRQTKFLIVLAAISLVLVICLRTCQGWKYHSADSGRVTSGASSGESQKRPKTTTFSGRADGPLSSSLRSPEFSPTR